MKRKRISACFWCGIRAGAIKSIFCAKDAKRLGIALADYRHRTHRMLWSYQVESAFFGRSIAEMLKE